MKWSLSLKSEHRLNKFDNMVLRRTCGPKGQEVTGDWRKLHNEECHYLYSSANIRLTKSRRMKWAMYHKWER